MKKLITVAALLAAGTALSGAAVVSTALAKNSDPDGVFGVKNAWELIYGKTGADIAAVEGIYSADQGNYSNVSESLTLTGLHSDSPLSESDSVILNSVSFLGFKTGTATSNVYLSIIDSEGAFVATSSVVDNSRAVSSDGEIYDGYYTFSFEDNVMLLAGETYTYKVVNATGDLASFRIGVAKATEGYNFSGTNLGSYFAAVMSMDVTVVPEPSSFGLLAGVGALALVAARRRRK